MLSGPGNRQRKAGVRVTKLPADRTGSPESWVCATGEEL